MNAPAIFSHFEAESPPALEIRNVSKNFIIDGRTFPVLSGISFTVKAGELVSIVGASGCGKSTLLRLVLGLDDGLSGEIYVHGERVKRPGPDRTIVFQDHRLLPWLTVERNVAVALRRSCLSRAQKRAAVAEQLRLVGLEAFARAYPAQLSGGMAQRAAIARALVNKPRLLLLDEPLGALDALTRLRLQDELKRIVENERTTALLVTHDVDEAVHLGHRVVVMTPHPGRIAAILPVPPAARHDRSSPEFTGLRDSVLRLLGVHAATTDSPSPAGHKPLAKPVSA